MFIYFNNAASTWPKPQVVPEVVRNYLGQYSTITDYIPPKTKELNSEIIVQQTKELTAQLFHANPDNILFMPNGTTAISTAINGILKPEDHVIISSMEHNSILHPLEALQKKGLQVTKVPNSLERGISPLYLENAIKCNTKMIIVTHASNVTGTLNPIKEIGRIAKSREILFMVDCTQTAGAYPINVEDTGIDLLAFTGHKYLMGPQGIGGLYLGNKLPLNVSAGVKQGTPNIPGIAGLGAGLKFIQETGLEKIRVHQELLVNYLLHGLKKITGIILYGPQDKNISIGIVSFNLKGLDPQTVTEILSNTYQITTQAGLHDAPDTHKFLGTYPKGTVRVSFSFFNTINEVDMLLHALKSIAKECA